VAILKEKLSIGGEIMELTIPEQIKQCEDIIENGGCYDTGGGYYLYCRNCCLYKNPCDSINIKPVELAKAKLKQLRGENMDIKERIKNLEERMAMTATAWNQMKNELIDIKTNLKLDDIEKRLDKLDKKEQEKEIEFVVGGVYETTKFTGAIVVLNNIVSKIKDDKRTFILIMINCDSNWGHFKTKEEMIEFLNNPKEEFKYTGRTLADIIKDNK
jgi:hypothetical protein